MHELEAEQTMTRSELSEYLREFADRLGGGEKVTLMVGNDSATINPPEDVQFEVGVSEGTSFLGTDPERTVKFRMSWQVAEEPEDEELSVQ